MGMDNITASTVEEIEAGAIEEFQPRLVNEKNITASAVEEMKAGAIEEFQPGLHRILIFTVENPNLN
jgi:hypothetical protein